MVFERTLNLPYCLKGPEVSEDSERVLFQCLKWAVQMADSQATIAEQTMPENIMVDMLNSKGYGLKSKKGGKGGGEKSVRRREGEEYERPQDTF